jgi:ankyrin repeat protein
VNEKDDNGLTPAYYGTVSGNADTTKMLVKRGTNVNTHGGGYGNALQAVSSEGYEPTVQLLLENKADFNAQGGLYGNMLQATSAGGHEPIVRLLLENNVDISRNAMPQLSCSVKFMEHTHKYSARMKSPSWKGGNCISTRKTCMAHSSTLNRKHTRGRIAVRRKVAHSKKGWGKESNSRETAEKQLIARYRHP